MGVEFLVKIAQVLQNTYVSGNVFNDMPQRGNRPIAMQWRFRFIAPVGATL